MRFNTYQLDAAKNKQSKIYSSQLPGTLCGTLPAATTDSTWYKVTCASVATRSHPSVARPISGDAVRIETTKDVPLHFTRIIVTGYSGYQRGMHLLVLDNVTARTLLANAYDTHDEFKTLKFDAALQGLKKGSIVIAAAKYEASRHLTLYAKTFFEEMGSTEIRKLGLEESWAFIGIVGQATSSTEQRNNKDTKS